MFKIRRASVASSNWGTGSRALHSALSSAWGRVLYVSSLLTVVFLLSLEILVAIGPFFSSGEAWQVAAFQWVVAWPVFLILGVVSAAVYPSYRRATTWGRVLSVFLINAITVVVVGQSLTVVAVWFFPGLARWLWFWAEW